MCDINRRCRLKLSRVTCNSWVGKTYAVEMEFTSPLTDDLKGLYYSSYKRGNDTIYLASSQFEPTNARRAFPCMDEPALKATFNIALVRPTHLMSLSNMPIVDTSRTWTEDGVDYVADVYQTTPRMSTYLLAFVVCDFDFTEDTTTNGVKYRAIARPEAKNSTGYALKVGVDVLAYLEDYFDVSYLKMVLEEDSLIRKQDAIHVIRWVSGSTVGRPIGWNFFKSNYDVITKRFRQSYRLVSSITSAFNTQYAKDDIVKFMKSQENTPGPGKRAFEKAIEATEHNIKWMEKNYPIIEKWLRDRNKS